jgi:phage nucleotide-binding protein
MTQNKKTVKKKSVISNSTIQNRITDIIINFDRMNITIYGTSGSGKTTLWSTFPGPILAVIVPAGNGSDELKSVATSEVKNKTKQFIVENTSDLFELAKYQNDTSQFKTVVIDNLTNLQNLMLKEILNLEEIPTQNEWGMATRDDYRQRSEQLKQVFRSLLSMNSNTVFIAHEKRLADDSGEIQQVVGEPFITAAVSDSPLLFLYSACDYIVRTGIENKIITKQIKKGAKVVTKEVDTGDKQYVLYTGPNEIYQTKFRKPKTVSLPVKIVDPNYEKIITLVKGVSDAGPLKEGRRKIKHRK